MIFWTVLTVSVSGVLYDKQQQKKITKKWCELVEPLSKEKFAVNTSPRKVTVFIAPPPSDYLDTSMSVWKRFVKPVLYSSGIDYDVFTEEKQGLIRYEVAERIRELRRELLKHEEELRQLESEARLWNRLRKMMVQGVNYFKSAEQIDEAKEKLLAEKFKREFDYKKLLGVYYKNQNSNTEFISEDALVSDPAMAGGVICIGRGAYKEYIAGLNEGILGPLEAPNETPTKSEGELQQDTEATHSDLKPTSEPADAEDQSQVSGTNDSESTPNPKTEDDSENTEKPKLLPKPYIFPDNYKDASIPAELSSLATVREVDSKIPALFHQPIVVLPMFNLVGFLNIPERIYRFYRRRYLADMYCRAAASCVLQKVRKFDHNSDLDLAKDEEEDWPKKWVQQGKEKESPWVQELKGDYRVSAMLNVFEPSMISDEDA